jgi:hypothetical protein
MTDKGFYDPSGKIEHGGSVLCTVLKKQPGGYAIQFGRNGMRGLLLTQDKFPPQSTLMVQFEGFQSGLAVFYVPQAVGERFAPEQQRQSGGYRQQYQSGGYEPQRNSGGYERQRNSGGYEQQYQSGGYAEQHQSCRYHQQYQSGGYARQDQSGGDSTQDDTDEYPEQHNAGGYNKPRKSSELRSSGAVRQRREIGVYRRPRPRAFSGEERQTRNCNPYAYDDPSSGDQLDDYDEYIQDESAPRTMPRNRFANLRPEEEGLVQSFFNSLKQALWPRSGV